MGKGEGDGFNKTNYTTQNYWEIWVVFVQTDITRPMYSSIRFRFELCSYNHLQLGGRHPVSNHCLQGHCYVL